MNRLTITAAVISALSYMCAAQAQTSDTWHVVTSKPSMSADYTSQQTGKQSLRFDMNQLGSANQVFNVQDGQHFNVSGFDTVEFVNTTADIGNGNSVIWVNRTATVSFTDIQNVYFGSEEAGLKTTNASAVLMSYGKVRFGENSKRLENFGLYENSGIYGLLANSSITKEADQNAEQTSEINVYADNITIKTSLSAVYAMVSPMSGNSTGKNTATIGLHGSNIALTSEKHSAVYVNAHSGADNQKAGGTSISIEADRDVSIEGNNGISINPSAKNTSTLNIKAGGNIHIKAGNGIQGALYSGKAAPGSSTTISGKNVAVTGNYYGINLNDGGNIKHVISAEENITIGGASKSVIGAEGTDLTLNPKSRVARLYRGKLTPIFTPGSRAHSSAAGQSHPVCVPTSIPRSHQPMRISL